MNFAVCLKDDAKRGSKDFRGSKDLARSSKRASMQGKPNKHGQKGNDEGKEAPPADVPEVRPGWKALLADAMLCTS